jgi:poly-gamma-glutamate synthesis protein (capsule biosynthesis protein)
METGAGLTTLCLGGDVMLGRGVDQVLPAAGDPRLREPHVHDAREYLRLAEAANGPVPRPVGPDYVWGDALDLLAAEAPDVRILNLETSVTTSDDFAAGKRVHYRMHPDNLPALRAVAPDVCALANNHVLDFGRAGLAETLGSLRAAGIPWVGAGADLAEARVPAVVELDAGRVVVLAAGTTSSGIPPAWAAAAGRPGLHLLPDRPEAAAELLAEQVAEVRRPGDVVVASVHWGGNWGYDVARADVRLAHLLVEAGVDVVHGHSSHHPRPVEVYHGRLVLYGCGDLVDDYEGIGGFEAYRDDLRLLYLATLDAESGRLLGLRMVPFQAHRLRLRRASLADAAWLGSTLDRMSRRFGQHVDVDPAGALRLRVAP